MQRVLDEILGTFIIVIIAFLGFIVIGGIMSFDPDNQLMHTGLNSYKIAVGLLLMVPPTSLFLYLTRMARG